MSQKTITIDLASGRLGEFVTRYQALTSEKQGARPVDQWLREFGILQGNIANEVTRQIKEQQQ